MAWIEVIAEDDAEGPLEDSYEKHRGGSGRVDNILKIHSLNPPSLEGHSELYRTLMFGRSGLSRTRREMIALVVSTSNRCHY